MKIKPEDFAVLKAAVEKVVADRPGLDRVYKESGMTHMRYRWDSLYRTKLKIGDGVGVQGDLNLYAYMNDDHIDTALRAILGSDYATPAKEA